MLQARDLAKAYSSGGKQVEAVRGVGLEVGAGQFVTVIGRSGSGKSTLLGMLGGLCRPDRGAVSVDGVGLWALAEDERADFRNRQIGFVFQFAGLLPTLRAIDNAVLPALLGPGSDMQAAYARAAGLLARLGLTDRREAYPAELSGGEQRRVALARALVNRPALLLADEPTGDLDEQTEAEVMAQLLGLCREENTTLVVVTHNLALAKQADQVLHMRQGSLADVPIDLADRQVVPVRFEEAPPDPLPAPSAPDQPLGSGLWRGLARMVAWAVPLVLAWLAVDYGVGLVQLHQKQQKQAERDALERTAMFRLRADVADIAYGPAGSYQLVLYAENRSPDEPLYLMAPSLQVFVQVGNLWKEVPARSTDDREGRVLQISSRQTFQFSFTPDVTSFEQLLPGYMHVRFRSTLLVSQSGEPKGDLVERVDDYYVHLKPHGASDEEILRKNRFPGKPPLWIPMPPH